LDRPLKVGGGIQPRLVTVLTPATTFTVAEDFSQIGRRVNSLEWLFTLQNDCFSHASTFHYRFLAHCPTNLSLSGYLSEKQLQ